MLTCEDLLINFIACFAINENAGFRLKVHDRDLILSMHISDIVLSVDSLSSAHLKLTILSIEIS